MFNKKAFFNMWHQIDSGRFLFGWINRLSLSMTYFLSTLMLVIVGAADYFSHVELTLSPWYTFPCFLMDWRIGRLPALAYAVLATVLQLVIGLTGTHSYPNYFYLVGDLIINLAFCIILIWIIAKLRLALEMEVILTRSDFLTKLANRDSLLEGLENQIERCRLQGKTLSVAMIDVDAFKGFNEVRGHSSGDLLLAAVAELLRDNFRSTDIIARTGDDEFTLVLPTMSPDIAESKLLALREKLGSLMMVRGWDITFGTAAICFVQSSISGEQAMLEIRGLMQEVKRRGKNEFTHQVLSIKNTDTEDVKDEVERKIC